MQLPEDCRASLVDSLGREWPLADHESASIVHEAQFQGFLEHFFNRKRPSAAGLFPLAGGWLEVRVDLVRDPLTANRQGALVVERPSASHTGYPHASPTSSMQRPWATRTSESRSNGRSPFAP